VCKCLRVYCVCVFVRIAQLEERDGTQIGTWAWLMILTDNNNARDLWGSRRFGVMAVTFETSGS